MGISRRQLNSQKGFRFPYREEVACASGQEVLIKAPGCHLSLSSGDGLALPGDFFSTLKGSGCVVKL